MTTVPADVLVIGFGGNVGDDGAILERFEHARGALNQLGEVTSAALYRTAPVVGDDGGTGLAGDRFASGRSQPPFLNTAVRVRVTDATPPELLAYLHELERLLGRDRTREVRWGPRPIDLDLLLWGARTVHTPELEIPHPRIAGRRFVILPLIDLFGDQLVVAGHSLAVLRARVAVQVVDEIKTSW
ncbi:MAG: 2-amino-4-hydroxy-6-hydroxymethyldihydropteridine diphosphokinase [Kofleriaceae bacterium]